ncbi:potassium-transporting ATPase subunit C [Pelagibacterium sp. H642]|uniref:potassium-transporting ATPase subunit C n=1 Tax=Pelagibacterium sp. H642 TaxID=1881069 RepID=UPI0028155B84|nr:potassium-transporting ATPase subunit C [Pelagibacterium sp. H642]WMT92124.1 potassium-transporting ATPase subunit C [Pelagibacterium sp. H642]
MHAFLASLRVAAATMAVCVGVYTGAVWALAQGVAPDAANGSLIVAEDGTVIGSRQVAQGFTEPGYFWPRPSAVDYNGAGAGGSNKSPASADLADRAAQTATEHGAAVDRPLPADLAAASGSGLDPHISEAGARYQVARIAAARDIDPAGIERLIDIAAFAPGGILSQDRIVNVLELNLALDAL